MTLTSTFNSLRSLVSRTLARETLLENGQRGLSIMAFSLMPLLALVFAKLSPMEDCFFDPNDPVRPVWEALMLRGAGWWPVSVLIVSLCCFVAMLRCAIRSEYEGDEARIGVHITKRVLVGVALVWFAGWYNAQAARDYLALRQSASPLQISIHGGLVEVRGRVKSYGGSDNTETVWMARPAADTLLR